MKYFNNLLLILFVLSFCFFLSVDKSSNAEVGMTEIDRGIFTVYDNSGGQAISPVVFSSNKTSNISIDKSSNGNTIVVYSDESNSSVGELSIYDPLGNKAIGPLVVTQSETGDIAVESLASGYILLAYSDFNNLSKGKIAIFNSLGESAIESVFFSENEVSGIQLLELANNNILLAYSSGESLHYGEFVIYGDTAIRALDPVAFNSGYTSNISITQLVNDNIFIAYTNGENSNYGEFVIFTPSGNKVTGPTVFNAGETGSISASILDNENVFIAYVNSDNSKYGEVIIYNTNQGTLSSPTIFNYAETDNIEIKELDNNNIFISYSSKSDINSGKLVIYNSEGEEVFEPNTFYSGKIDNISITKLASGYIFIAFSENNILECSESDWVFSLEPSECPLAGIQTKKWELLNVCTDGITHDAQEEVSCTYSSEIRNCAESDWQYTLEPAECPYSGVQTKKWQLTNECLGNVVHPESEQISCFFSKVISSDYLKILKGKIILKVESNGEAYYINNVGKMFYLGRPADAFGIMREQGVGITDSDLEKIPIGSGEEFSSEKINNVFAAKQVGKIFLQVEKNGEAWYVYPQDSKRYYLGRPQDAFNVMRELGLGISNHDFSQL